MNVCYVKSDIIKTEEEIKEELQIILNDLVGNTTIIKFPL